MARNNNSFSTMQVVDEYGNTRTVVNKGGSIRVVENTEEIERTSVNKPLLYIGGFGIGVGMGYIAYKIFGD